MQKIHQMNAYLNKTLDKLQQQQEASFIKRDDIFLPLELIIDLKANKTPDNELSITKSIIDFFDLALANTEINFDSPSSSPSASSALKNKLIEYFNFVRFAKNTSTPDPNSQTHTNEQDKSKIKVPSLSFILLTNNPNSSSNTSSSISNRLLNDDALLKGESKTWSYHHKVELNDDRGKTIARQLFFKLNKQNSIEPLELPLCCRSNWVPPSAAQIFTQQKQQSSPPVKYIIRLNINCKNYDLMLFFYRLLFDKCPNYSKKDFSLFILKNQKIGNDFNIEFQLSLKHDLNVSVEKLKNTVMVYNMSNRDTFSNVIRLLDGFVEEIVKDKVYSVYDPERNKLILVDCSAYPMSSSSSLFNGTSGLADVYYANLTKSIKLNSMKNPASSYSPNSNTSSSSEINSFDSGKDSGRWSCSVASSPTSLSSSNQPKTSSPTLSSLKRNLSCVNPASAFKNQHAKPNNYEYLANCTDNNETLSVKSLIRRFSSNTVDKKGQAGVVRPAQQFVSAKKAPMSKPTPNRGKKTTENNKNGYYYRQEGDYDYAGDEEEEENVYACSEEEESDFLNSSDGVNQKSDEIDDDELIAGYNYKYEMDSDEKKLEALLKKASTNSMQVLNALAYKNANYLNRLNGSNASISKYQAPKQIGMSKNPCQNRKEIDYAKKHSQQVPWGDLNRHHRHRSQSALNEPYDPPINNNTSQINNQTNKSHSCIKGVLTNGSNSLNRKKSKSVTFMDTICGLKKSQPYHQSQCNVAPSYIEPTKLRNPTNRSAQERLGIRFDLDRPRPKSTVPFSSSSNNLASSSFSSGSSSYFDFSKYNPQKENVNVKAFNQSSSRCAPKNDDDITSFLDDVEDCFITANVDNDDIYVDRFSLNQNRYNNQFASSPVDYQQRNHEFMNNSFSNCLIDINESGRNGFMNEAQKPCVGITAETRFRRAHTLDMIRSTRMPLRNEEEFIQQTVQSKNQHAMKQNVNNQIKQKQLLQQQQQQQDSRYGYAHNSMSNLNSFNNSGHKQPSFKYNLPVAKF